jgi:hypothetical protein
MSNGTPEKTLLQSIIRLLDTTATDGSYDNLVHVLSLLCILTILNRNPSQAVQSASPPTSTGSPIQKLLGELTKGDNSGGPSVDTLMSLLPLLNSPQLKSKLNASNMSSILGLINSLGGSNHEKQDASKSEKHTEVKPDSKKEAPAAAVTDSIPIPLKTDPDSDEDSKRNSGRYLNWKTSF